MRAEGPIWMTYVELKAGTTLYYGQLAVFFFWSMRVSGAEAVVAAASPFIGQGESAMLIKPFVAHLTQAELHQVMCSGFATIAYVTLPL